MSTKTTYKQTELGLIPTDWDFDNMGNLSKVNQGLQIPISDRFSEQVENSLFYITNEFLKEDSKNKYFIKNPPKSVIANKDDVLMTRTGNTGKVVTGVEGAFHNNFFKIKYDETKLNKDFLVGYLKSPRTQYSILTLSGNSTIPDLNHSDFYRIKIPLPPLPEQKAIADCISTWDNAIEKQSQLIELHTQRKKALMQKLLTGKKRLPGFSEEWKEVKLGDLFEKINRKNEEGNTNVVTISAQRGFVKQTDFFNKSVASETLDNYSLIYHGEFCYNKSYSNGYPLGATKRLIAFEKAVVTTLYICFKIKDQKKSNGSFFEQFFEANSLDRSLIKIAQEGGRAHGLLNVSLSDFFNIKIKLPPIEEQTAIAEILAAADRELQLQKEKLAQLQAQKKGLMQVLLTGKKRLIN